MALRTPAGASDKGARLVLTLVVPDVSLKELKSMTLSAKVEGQSLASEMLSIAGERELSREVPASALRKPLTEIEFSLDRFLNKDGAQYGVIVTSVGLDLK